MKTPITTIVMILAASLLAQAEPPEGKERKGKRQHRPLPPEVIEQFDKDGDGKLNEEERKAAREARKAKILAEFDKDGDGELNEEERKAMREARRAKMLEKFDKDGDGKLSREEKKAMREAIGKRARGKGKGKDKGGDRPPRRERRPARQD